MSRTLLVQLWSFHTARVHVANRQDFSPFDLGGRDLFEVIHSTLGKLESLDDEDRQRWVTMGETHRAGSRSLLVSASAGKYGESGDVVDRTDGSVAFTLGEDHAATVPTRSLIVVPDAGLYAVAFYERSSGRGASGLDLLKRLHHDWVGQCTGITWKTEWLEESGAWVRAAHMKAVEVRRFAGTTGTAQSGVKPLGEYSWGLKAARGNFLPHRDLEQILDQPKYAHTLLGSAVEPEDGDRVFVELVRDGRQKTYAIEGGNLPRMQMEIDDLDDKQFVGACAEHAAAVVFPRLSGSWNASWVLPLASP